MIINIFIIEDDLILQKLYEQILNVYGFNVIGKANNGEDGIRQYKEFSNKPEIILLDHRMPVKDGIETAKELKKLNSQSKIIFASADEGIKNQAISAGANLFLSKPFSNEQLIEQIINCLNV